MVQGRKRTGGFMEKDENVLSETISLKEWAGLALFRGRVYGFLSGIYNCLPDDKFAENLFSPEMAAFITSMRGIEDLPQDMQDGLELIEDFIRHHENMPLNEVKTVLGVDRTRLLRGLKPGYSPPPPYESVYLGSENQPLVQAGAAVVRTYASAGVVLPEEVRDQPDFIGIELDFMRHLCKKEADAWLDRDREEATRAMERQQNFLEEHITLWIPRFCDVMFQESRNNFYRGIARMTKGFVSDEAEKAKQLVEWAQIAVES
jgi:putative dimethyl sulfoxide reductase chaperone